MINISTEHHGPLLEAPTITLCVDFTDGWKNQNLSANYTSIEDSIAGECNHPQTANEIVKCVDEHVYNTDELIEQIDWIN